MTRSLAPPQIEWFAGGRLNVAVNCVDRHVRAGLGERIAYFFEGERGDRRSLTFAELQREVAKAANALTALGVGQGDRGGRLPARPARDRHRDARDRAHRRHPLPRLRRLLGGGAALPGGGHGGEVVVASDGQFRRGAAVPVKHAVDAAVAGLPHVEHVLLVRRTGQDVPFTPDRDVWWHDVVDTASDTHDAQAFDAETPLFIIYTSGTTGKPKGIVHTSGGYLTAASWTHWAAFDAKPDDVHWCTADLAWVTAHTYALYGPLSNATTQLISEGTPDTPTATRHFEVIERYGVTTYYTAPTLIRTLATRFPDGPPAAHDLSSIRLLGSVGEAINPAACVCSASTSGRAPRPSWTRGGSRRPDPQ